MSDIHHNKPAATSNVEELRYERKARFERISPEHVRQWIREHPAHLTEVYQPRWINNVYFDTRQLTYHRDHVAGITPRKKVRIRWYGDFDQPAEMLQVEIKARRGAAMRKTVMKIPSLTVADLLKTGTLQAHLQQHGAPAFLRELFATLEPTLMNRYHRCYFQSRLQPVRVTLDRAMTFAPPRVRSVTSRWNHGDPAVVVEVKYAQSEALAGQTVCDQLPVSLSKNSKYVTGIDLVHAL